MTNSPSDGSTAKQSSLVGRTRPFSVSPYAETTIACRRVYRHSNAASVGRRPGESHAWRRDRLSGAYLASSAARSYAAFSMCRDFSLVPSGTRNGKVHENSGTLPTSTKVAAVLYFLSLASVIEGRFIAAG